MATDLFDFALDDATAESLIKDANLGKGGRDLIRLGVIARTLRSGARKAIYMAKALGGHEVATRAALAALKKADLAETIAQLAALSGMTTIKVKVLNDGDGKPRYYRYDSASSAAVTDSILATDEGGAGRWLASEDDLSESAAGLSYNVAVLKYMGSRTVAQIDALGPASGDAYVATDAGTPMAGASDALVAGDLAVYDGANWKKVVSASGGFVPAGTFAVVGTGTLVAPLTDVTDRSKLAKFGGASNTPTLYAPADGWQVFVIGENVPEENRGYIYDTNAWKPVPNDAIVDGDFTSSGLMERTGAGAYTSRAPVATTNVGAGDAGKPLVLDGNGKAAGRVLETDGTKLDGIEAMADVTDLANVTAALGVTVAAAVATTNVGAGDAGKAIKLDGAGKLAGFVLEDATTDTGVGAGNAGKLVKLDAGGKLDDRDVGSDGTKLDGIEAMADVTDLANVTAALGVTAATAVATSAGAADDGKAVKLGTDGKLSVSLLRSSSTVLTPSPDVGVTPGDDELANIASEAATAFATTKSISAGATAGSYWLLRAVVQGIKQNAGDTLKIEMFVGSVLVADIAAYDYAPTEIIDLRADVFVDVAGAAGKFHSLGIGSRPGTNPKTTSLVTQDADFSAAVTVSVKATWVGTQHVDNIADLIVLSSTQYAS